MADHKGDPAKRTEDCKIDIFTPDENGPKDIFGKPRMGTWGRCPNLKETGGGMDGERWECTVCGESYYLDYDEMR